MIKMGIGITIIVGIIGIPIIVVIEIALIIMIIIYTTVILRGRRP